MMAEYPLKQLERHIFIRKPSEHSRRRVCLNFVPAHPPRVYITDVETTGFYDYPDFHHTEVVVVGEGHLKGKARGRTMVRVSDTAQLLDHIAHHFDVLASETTNEGTRTVLQGVVRDGIRALGLQMPEE